MSSTTQQSKCIACIFSFLMLFYLWVDWRQHKEMDYLRWFLTDRRYIEFSSPATFPSETSTRIIFNAVEAFFFYFTLFDYRYTWMSLSSNIELPFYFCLILNFLYKNLNKWPTFLKSLIWNMLFKFYRIFKRARYTIFRWPCAHATKSTYRQFAI